MRHVHNSGIGNEYRRLDKIPRCRACGKRMLSSRWGGWECDCSRVVPVIRCIDALVPGGKR
jgi:tRNA(Ile2) C34 agmatinyltransferase TiaS